MCTGEWCRIRAFCTGKQLLTVTITGIGFQDIQDAAFQVTQMPGILRYGKCQGQYYGGDGSQKQGSWFNSLVGRKP